jgi:hypothetical protein
LRHARATALRRLRDWRNVRDYEHLLGPLPAHPSGVKILAGLSLHKRSNLRLWFEVGQDLVIFIHHRKSTGGIREKQGLLWTSLFRSMKTYCAVLVLCESGFGEQAGMLCRSLFEDLLVTHWMKRTGAMRRVISMAWIDPP